MDTTNIKEGEIVMINTNHYKRVGNKLINVNNPNDTRDIDNSTSMLGVMLEKLNIING